MTRPLVYLAGPIAGLSYDDARHGWRGEAAAILKRYEIGVLSPMRGKDALRDIGSLDNVAAIFEMDPVFTSPASVMSRDENDIRRCDAVLLWLPRDAVSRTPFIGTGMEIGMAHVLRKPMVAVVDGDLETHPHAAHPMTQIAIGRFTNDLEHACLAIAHIVKEGV